MVPQRQGRGDRVQLPPLEKNTPINLYKLNKISYLKNGGYIYITINDATAQYNFPYIKPPIRKIKEIFRDLYHQLPYKTIPKVMVLYSVKDVVK